MKNNVNMTQGNALGIIIRFAVPIMLSSLLQHNYHLVDNLIGKDGKAHSANVVVVIQKDNERVTHKIVTVYPDKKGG